MADTSFALLELDSLEEEIDALRQKIKTVNKRVATQDKALDQLQVDTPGLNKNAFKAFLRQPYLIIPQSTTEVHVVVPKFINFQVGWLLRETESFNIFVFNQYSAWLGDAPQEILDLIRIQKPFEATLSGNMVEYAQDQKKAVLEHLGKFLEKAKDTGALIRKGYEFDIIAEIVRLGALPFRPAPVSEKDLRITAPVDDRLNTITLRDYQKPAFDAFMKYGAIGIYYPTGAGKSFIALKIADQLLGKKLVIVPTNTLKEQWNTYIHDTMKHRSGEWTVATYQAKHPMNQEWTLVIYDECHKLPANQFSRLALIKTKYRIGLSASPFREDGRENYIIALTGYPIGLNWRKYMEEVGRAYHPVHVWVVKSQSDKLTYLAKFLDPTKKTLIFCDSIELGKLISKRYNYPFVYGNSQDRMETINKNQITVVSRVADLGISIKGLQRIVEVDFLFGCYDDQTEVLSKRGWVKFPDLIESDKIAYLNGKGYLEFASPIEIQKYPYEGKMLHFKGKSYDLLVTPNHRMFVHFARSSTKPFSFKSAEELAKMGISLRNYELKKDAKWRGKNPEIFTLPPLAPTEYVASQQKIYNKAKVLEGSGLSTIQIAQKLDVNYFTVNHWLKRGSEPLNRMIRYKPLPPIKMEDWMHVLGWYLSEGSTSDRSVKFAQFKEREKLRQNLIPLGLPICEIPDGFQISNKQLAEYCKCFGHAKDKFIPPEIKQYSPELLQALLDSLCAGDGSIKHDNLRLYYSSSKRLADDVQEIAIKCGYATTLTTRTRLLNGGFAKNFLNTEYCVIMVKKNTTPQISTIVNEIDYKGFVYCATVPGGVMLVRRNGRAVWCGNSRQQEIQRTGRLMHGEKGDIRHDILMTKHEITEYGKRLWGLEEKGFQIEIEEVGKK